MHSHFSGQQQADNGTFFDIIRYDFFVIYFGDNIYFVQQADNGTFFDIIRYDFFVIYFGDNICLFLYKMRVFC